MEEPISRTLAQLAKTYVGAFIKRVEKLDISRYHYVLLLIAEYEGKLTQKKLAEITGKDKSAIVNIINALTAQGYVYREGNPNDRRQQLIKVTAKAEQDLPTIRESVKLLNNKATEGITAENLDIFNEVLQQMRHNLNPLAANQVTTLRKQKTPTRNPEYETKIHNLSAACFTDRLPGIQ